MFEICRRIPIIINAFYDDVHLFSVHLPIVLKTIIDIQTLQIEKKLEISQHCRIHKSNLYWSSLETLDNKNAKQM